MKRCWTAAPAAACLALLLTACGVGASSAGASSNGASTNSASTNSASSNDVTSGAAASSSSGSAVAADPSTSRAGTPGTTKTQQSSAAAITPSPATATSAVQNRDYMDAPAGFWYGSDSWPIPVNGSGPYTNPVIGGGYGGYIGMAGNWARWLGCRTGNFLAWSSTNSYQANVNYTRYGRGIGTGVYWYMGGPGVDPRYSGTTHEAYGWGAAQAVQAIAAANRDHVTYRVLFMDIEMPGIAPAPDNGWASVYTSACGGIRTGRSVSPALARAEFNGFADYLTAHSHYLYGVYSEPGTWSQVFGNKGYIPHTYEWTYMPETASLSRAPYGWCLKGTGQCAQFFGGVTGSSPYAVMWQWSGGGGIRNPIGDFDQIRTTYIR